MSIGGVRRESAIRPVFNRKDGCWVPAVNEGGRLSANNGGGLTETSKLSRRSWPRNGVPVESPSRSFTFNDLLVSAGACRLAGALQYWLADVTCAVIVRLGFGSDQIGFECKAHLKAR